jgi:hypothetical protein
MPHGLGMLAIAVAHTKMPRKAEIRLLAEPKRLWLLDMAARTEAAAW